ncbi:hypothetical protein [Streptomyces sp. NPDC048638]|uniref:hypothetical protein n=1 Tax=Streptomyces sp. NPDC048638 TaxID=3365580 RepID=UPI0037148BE8
MISTFHRRKGGAPLLGASAPGESGPFGPYGEAPPHDEHGDLAEPTRADRETTAPRG